ncbi:hypothetical protein TNCV_3493831 [Trichonephila clavipes]|nr:hypothetical protein TNCV_3493831 [Trichonephila clavipes]
MDLVIRNHGQMTRTAYELASLLLTSTPTGGRLSLDRFNEHYLPCTAGLQRYHARTHDTLATTKEIKSLVMASRNEKIPKKVTMEKIRMDIAKFQKHVASMPKEHFKISKYQQEDSHFCMGVCYVHRPIGPHSSIMEKIRHPLQSQALPPPNAGVNKMTGTVETQYKELLNPIKDPEQSFAIDISKLLNSYVKGVEYLHNLATKLYQKLIKKNTRGEPVGNKGDYTLNKCRVTRSGWILLPTVSPELIEFDQSIPDYTIEEEQEDSDQIDDDTCHDSDMPESTPADEGYPPSTGCTNTPGSENPCSQTPGCEDPLSQGTDEGLGSLPCTPQESESQVDSITNMPLEVPSGPQLGEVAPCSDSVPDTPMEDKLDSNVLQKLLDPHNQELTIDELIEMHDQEQDVEELESSDSIQSENQMTVRNLVLLKTG